jgi:hypothetical protein
MLFSPSMRGFYSADLHGAAIPSDVVEITAADHAALLAGQAAGSEIVPGPDGAPILADRIAPPPPPPIRAIAPYAFRLRLPAATRRAVTLAASHAMEAGDATLQTWLDDLHSTRVVLLDHPDIAAGVAMLQAAGLVTQAEAAALLADGTAEEV